MLLLVSVVATAVLVLAPAAQAAGTLTVNKTATPAEGGTVAPGDTISYSVVVTNAGPDPVTGITLSDPTPADTTYVAGSAEVNGAPVADDPTGDPNPFEPTPFPLPDLPAGNAHTVVFDVTVDAGVANCTEVSNVATVDAADEDPASDLSDDAVHTVSDAAPTLAVTKTATPAEATEVRPGDTITYSVKVENTAAGTDAIACDVEFSDPTPANTEYVAGSAKDDGTAVPDGPGPGSTNPFETAYPLSADDLDPGDSATLEFQVRVASAAADGTVVTNTAQALAANHAAVTDTATHTVRVAAAPAPTPTPTPEARRGGGGLGRGGGGGGGGGLAGGGTGSVGAAGAGTGGQDDLAFTGLEDSTGLFLVALTLLLAGLTLVTRGRSIERRAVTLWDDARVRGSRLMTRDPSVGPWFFSARRR
ncbi:MAG TPA: hypothetical protein VG602_01580 [Actinomycetota bacterium]|nr:hypothetical protein [Actinomycetota bacterium]